MRALCSQHVMRTHVNMPRRVRCVRTLYVLIYGECGVYERRFLRVDVGEMREV